MDEEDMLQCLNLPPLLKERIRETNKRMPLDLPVPDTGHRVRSHSFVLYLPTVVLRKMHNPAFALACRLANHHKVPLVVLAVVVDDRHHPQCASLSQDTSTCTKKETVMTARRLAFVLEALQEASREWQAHGAAVFVRVHGPDGARKAHHLTMARQAAAVVMDEPFVNPHLTLVRSVEKAANHNVPCFRVDGSTIVPPSHILTSSKQQIKVPEKAWRWQSMTQDRRKEHVMAAVREGQLDAPLLQIRLDPSNYSNESMKPIRNMLPLEWRDVESAMAPGIRPWTSQELMDIVDLKDWAMQWPGSDSSVPPCRQTHGGAAQTRWNTFCQQQHVGRSGGTPISQYAKNRNNIQLPHAVSRMSCYLNYGTISIFQMIHDIWQHPSNTAKFQDEILKWREISYAHAFAHPEDYATESSIPLWASRYLNSCHSPNNISTSSAAATPAPTDSKATHVNLQHLEEGNTVNPTWNAMQRYLVSTGELHNNARMTWGKTVVHWQKHNCSIRQILSQLCYLNDRYALDGLSPPSYAGILWCFGWGDKPSQQRSHGESGGSMISEKPPWRYRVGPEGFQEAERRLLDNHSNTNNTSANNGSQPSIASVILRVSNNNKRKVDAKGEDQNIQSASLSPKKAMKGSKASVENTLLSYFPSKNSDTNHVRTLG